MKGGFLINTAIEKTYQDYLREREKNREWSTSIFRYVDREIGLTGKSLLDIGCGFGWHSEMFSRYGADVTGIDLSTDKLEIFERNAKGKKNLRCLYCSAFDLPFEAGSFDIVFMNQTIHHFIDHNPALKETNRVLKDDGYIVISDNNRLNLIHTQDRFRHPGNDDRGFKEHYYKHFFTHNEIRIILQDHGFDDVKFHIPGKKFNMIYNIFKTSLLLTLYNIFITPNYFTYAKKKESEKEK